MFQSATCRLKETLDCPAPSKEKSKSDPVNQGNLKAWFKTFRPAAAEFSSPGCCDAGPSPLDRCDLSSR